MSIIPETNCFGNFSQIEEPKIQIIPVPYEHTTCFQKGTKNGPQAILNASLYLEAFDDELWEDISKIGINTTDFIQLDFVNNRAIKPFQEVEQAVKTSLISGSLPIVLGGENSLSYGSVKAIYDLYPEISILHFDARCDLKSEYKSNKYSFCSSLRHIYEAMPDLNIVLLGVRSISEEEKEWLEEQNPNIEIFFAKDKNDLTINEIISSLTKNVFISFDFSVLDPSIMPSVHQPEPNGLDWVQVTEILKNICTCKEIIGMEFLGFTPMPQFKVPDYLAAKLIYKTIGYTFARHLGAFDEEDNDSEDENFCEEELELLEEAAIDD